MAGYKQAQELGSLVVDKTWRKRGLGSYLVEYLIEQATQALYLECADWLTTFYSRFAFVPMTSEKLPPSLKWKFGLTQLLTKIVPVISLKIM